MKWAVTGKLSSTGQLQLKARSTIAAKTAVANSRFVRWRFRCLCGSCCCCCCCVHCVKGRRLSLQTWGTCCGGFYGVHSESGRLIKSSSSSSGQKPIWHTVYGLFKIQIGIKWNYSANKRCSHLTNRHIFDCNPGRKRRIQVLFVMISRQFPFGFRLSEMYLGTANTMFFLSLKGKSRDFTCIGLCCCQRQHLMCRSSSVY